VGTINVKQSPVLKRVYDQMTEPKWVMAFGVCASSGGFYDNYATLQGADRVSPAAATVPGARPRRGQVPAGATTPRDRARNDRRTYRSEMSGGAALASIEVPAYDVQNKPKVEPRYQVAYSLCSITRHHSLRVRVELRSDDLKVPSITSLYRTADWWERYVYDM